MRLLLVSDYYPPAPGGLASHVQSLARALADAGDEVVVVCSEGGPDADHRIRVYSSGVSVGMLRNRGGPNSEMPPPWPDHRLSAAISRGVEAAKTDVIHAHGWCAFSAVKTAVGPPEVPLVVTLHDYGLLCPMRSLFTGEGHCARYAGIACITCFGANQSMSKRSALAAAIVAYRRKLVRATSAFISVSGAVADEHRQLIPPEKLQVIHNFVADPVGPPTVRPSDGPPRLLFVGPDDHYKGVEAAIEVFRRVRSRPGLGATVLDHAGGSRSDEPDGPEGPDGIVGWGRLSPPALVERFAASSVVVVPALWSDPCPTVALEAMAAARPIAGFAGGGLPELVGGTGSLVEVGDVQGLATAVESLLRDPVRAAQLGREARERVVRFTTSSVVPQIRSVYADIASHSRSAAHDTEIPSPG